MRLDVKPRKILVLTPGAIRGVALLLVRILRDGLVAEAPLEHLVHLVNGVAELVA